MVDQAVLMEAAPVLVQEILVEMAAAGQFELCGDQEEVFQVMRLRK
jgi:hypothetical protein